MVFSFIQARMPMGRRQPASRFLVATGSLIRDGCGIWSEQEEIVPNAWALDYFSPGLLAPMIITAAGTAGTGAKSLSIPMLLINRPPLFLPHESRSPKL